MKQTVDRNHNDTYYEKDGVVAHDFLLRCASCHKLVLHTYLNEKGSCSCGNRKVNEIRGLTAWEWFQIRVGIIQFQDSGRMLAEFNPEWPNWVAWLLPHKWGGR